MSIVDIALHIYAIGIDVKVEYLALTVMMKRDNVLGILKIGTLCAVPSGFPRKINTIKLTDELVSKFLPVFYRPSNSLFFGWR